MFLLRLLHSAVQAMGSIVLFAITCGIGALAFVYVGGATVDLLMPLEGLLRGTGIIPILAVLSGLIALVVVLFAISTIVVGVIDRCKLDKLFH